MNLQGRLKSSRKLSSELTFDFQIESIGKLGSIISLEYPCRSELGNYHLDEILTRASGGFCIWDEVVAFTHTNWGMRGWRAALQKEIWELGLIAS